MLLRLLVLTLLLPLVFLGAAAPDTPPWPAPADVFALDDARMNTWSAQPAASVVLTGRLLNLSDEQRRQLTLSASLVTLRESGQVSLPVTVAADDTFRLELPAIFPRQQLWFRIKPLGYFEIVLHRGLHLEIDAAKLAPLTPTSTPGCTFGGPDGTFNSELNRFVFAFRRERRLALDQALRETSAGPDGTFTERSQRLAALHRDYLALLHEFAPTEAGWFLRHEIDADYHAAVMRAAITTKHDLSTTPLWPEITRHASYAVTNEQTAFFRTLKSYLLVLSTSAAPTRAAPTPSTPSSRPNLLDRAIAAGTPLLPPGKLEIALLFFVPKAPDEARTVIEQLRQRASAPWIQAYLDFWRRDTDRRVNAINAALAQSTPHLPAAQPLGPPLATLSTSATLHHWPDLAGRELLARITRAFPGKALLLDFWGPWCAPCLADLPHSEKLHAALKDAPVEFIYLGSRTTDTPWRRTIADLRLSGTHVLLTDHQVDELMAFFGASGFPTYVFIDREGRHRPNAITRFAHTTPEAFRRLLD